MSDKFGVQLDFETADRILVCALKEHLEYIKKEVDEVDELQRLVTDAEAIAHVENLRLITAMKVVLKYFGETV